MDTYFLIKHGELVIENGFLFIEPLSMHSNLEFIMQQWLTSCIMYLLYLLFGHIGALIYVYVIYSLIVLIIYKTCFLISKDHNSSCITTLIGEVILLLFAESRPHLLSLLCITLVIYLLENYIYSNKIRYLIFIPFITLIQINCHMSMFPFIFMAIFPYLCRFKVFTGKYIEENFDYKKLPIIITTLFSLFMLIINPYKLNGILYIFKSMNPSLSLYSFEMAASSIENYGGQILLVILIICIVLFIRIKNKFILRHLILFAGAIFLSLFAIRNVMLLSIAFPIFLISLIRNIKDKDLIVKSLFGYYQITLPCIIIFIFIYRFLNIQDYDIKNINETNALYSDKYYAYDIVDYLVENYESKVTCYNDPYLGSYLEFNEIQPYIDYRAEVYLYTINNKKDILNEYLLLQYGRVDIDDFIKEYKFEYFLINNNDIIYNYLVENNYDLLYNNNIYYLFKNNKLNIMN